MVGVIITRPSISRPADFAICKMIRMDRNIFQRRTYFLDELRRWLFKTKDHHPKITNVVIPFGGHSAPGSMLWGACGQFPSIFHW
jgi:hypothetical protein